MFKKHCLVILCMLLVCLMIGGTAMAAQDGPVKIYIDDEPFGEGAAGLLVNDETVYVPLRDICEYYGSAVAWDAASRTATVTLEGTVITAREGSEVVEANGRMLYDEYAPMLYGARLMIPARVLARAMNARVRWNESTRTVFLYTGLTPLESGESFYDQDDLYWLSRIIHAEAENQPLEGKIGVGNVVMNRVESDSFSDSIYNVIFERGQFSPVARGSIYRTPGAESVLAAKLALEGTNTVGDAIFFQNTSVTGSNWMSRTRPVIAKLGNHTFYA